MKPHMVGKALIAVSALSLAASPIALSTASAQGYGDSYYNDGPNGPPPDYNNGPPPDDNGPPSDYDYDNGPPPNYDSGGPPAPPPGYQPPPDAAQQREQDEHYGRYAEQWAQDYCVKSGGNVAAGAVIGGLFGALVGSAVGGPYHSGGGAAIGAAIGGTSGAAIAANSGGATSPGCPPGYVVRSDAPAFYYQAYGGPYYYAAPGWYRPWVWYDGRWSYRPYPYHAWDYNHYYRHDRWDHDRGHDRWDYDRR